MSMTNMSAAYDEEWTLVGSAVSEPDREDIRRCLSGEEGAYARIIKRYEAQIATQMWRFSRDRGVLEELVQEVFVEAYTSLGNYKGKAPFLHWLRRIATRVGYRYWKTKARDQVRRDTLAARREEWLGRGKPETPSEAGEFVHVLLDRLPPQERMVLTLLYYEQWNTAEIAEHMGWTRSLVKVRAFRARKKLKGYLEEAGYEAGQE